MIRLILFCICYVSLCFLTQRGAANNPDDNLIRDEGSTNDRLSKIQDFLRMARSGNGDIDLNELLSKNIDDPVPLQNFNISNQGFLSDIFGQFEDLELHGLKGFEVDRLAINLANMNLSAAFSVPMLSIVGKYSLDGTVTFFPISGEGPFYMNLSTITLRGHSVIEKNPKIAALGDIKLDSDVENINIHFENLMGGGTWGSISNSLLNQLSELILGELKPTMLNELSAYLRHQFDEVVFVQLSPGFTDPRSTTLLDAILKEVSDIMVEKKIEPLPLPDFKEVYEKKILFLSTRGELSIYNGTLFGLSTLARKGDVITLFENNSLIFEADFVFENLTGDYLWEIQAFGMDPNGQLDIQVKAIEGFIRIVLDLKVESSLTLDKFLIKDIRHIWLDLKGLGTWDYLLESVVNIVTNGLKLQLADAITAPVRKSIQEQLDRFNKDIWN